MDISRIVSVTCVLLLSLCFLIAVYTVTVLKNTLKESTETNLELKAFVETLENDLDTVAPESAKEDLSNDKTDSSLPVDVLANQFCIRETNGRVAIYTADGYLIRLLDLSTDTLPSADRLALQQGIYLSSRKEVLALMEDFGA